MGMNGSSGEYSYFWLQRLHSLTGFILALAFILLFLVPYSTVLGGDAAFTRFMAKSGEIPLLGWAELLLVGVPLVFHIAMGLMIIHGGQINVFAYGLYKNWMYALQRLTGLILIPFVLYHVYETKLAFLFSGRSIDAKHMHAILTPGWSKAFYITGIICAAFYFGNGLAGALSSWGLAASRRSRTAAAIAGWIITILMAVWGVRLILEF